MKNNKKINIGFTYGDPAGIGPEILFKALKKNLNVKLNFIIFGDSRIIQFNKSKFSYCNYDFLLPKYKLGRPNTNTGKHAYECLIQAISSANKKEIEYLITGPVSKSIVSKSVPGFTGQTEELARRSKMKDVIMLFVSFDLRISIFTRHIPISQVASCLTKKTLGIHLTLLNNELKSKFKIKNPRIGVLGLNPHAGEKGIIGREEIEIIKPVIDSMNKKGYKIFGPLSPDATLAIAGQDYLHKRKQKFDAIVSIYHDQALPMFKAVTGKHGLNITLGLPYLRISPDHGTAFDIAGKNKADFSGISSAIKLIQSLNT